MQFASHIIAPELNYRLAVLDKVTDTSKPEAHMRVATLREIFTEVGDINTSRAINALSLPIAELNQSRLLQLVQHI